MAFNWKGIYRGNVVENKYGRLERDGQYVMLLEEHIDLLFIRLDRLEREVQHISKTMGLFFDLLKGGKENGDKI
jgi:hypothetical protein